MRRIAPHLASRFLAVLAALTLLLSVTVGPSHCMALASEGLEALHGEATAWSDDTDEELASVVEEHTLDDEDAEFDEGEGEVLHAATARPLPDRRLRAHRARGPPVVDGWATFQLTQAPRGPPLA